MPDATDTAAITTAATHTHPIASVKRACMFTPVNTTAAASTTSAGKIPVTCRRGNTPNGVTGADDGRAGGRARRVAIGCLLNRAAPIAALCVI